MKSWVLITTILFSTPEKDFSGVVIHEFKNRIECDVRLQKTQNMEIEFNYFMSIKVDNRCEEKK
tara:strand:- start:263 stop:454 length:192 start_codon:yes stop_codon:yes gene_type:complete